MGASLGGDEDFVVAFLLDRGGAFGNGTFLVAHELGALDELQVFEVEELLGEGREVVVGLQLFLLSL